MTQETKIKNTSVAYKIAKSVAALATVITLFVWYQPSGVKGFYDNDLSGHIANAAVRQAQADWYKQQGANAVDIYGADSYLGSFTNNANMSDYILRLRRAGVKSIGYVYSSTGSMARLKAYQAAQVSDSMKFSRVVMEEEPYNTGLYPKFYSDLAAWDAYADANKMEHDIYIGWPSQAAIDTIVKHQCRIFVHAYGQFDKYSNVGSWIYGYSKTRFGMIADASKRLNVPPPNTISLYSVENPDSSKTQFGFKYFKTHPFGDAYSSYLSYFSVNASSQIKSGIVNGGYQIFTSSMAKAARPYKP